MRNFRTNMIEYDTNEDIQKLEQLDLELQKVIQETKKDCCKCKWDYWIRQELQLYQWFMHELQIAKNRVKRVLNIN